MQPDERNTIIWHPTFIDRVRTSRHTSSVQTASSLHFYRFTILSEPEVVREDGVAYQQEPGVETFVVLPLNGDPPEFITEKPIRKEIEKQDQFNVLTGLATFDGQRKLYFSGFQAQWIKNNDKSYRLNRIPVIYEIIID